MAEVFVLNKPERLRALRDYLHQTWQAAVQRGQPLIVTVETEHRQRSSEQNRRYWALLREIEEGAEQDGQRFPSTTWHLFFRQQFIGMNEVVLPTGEILMEPISTTTLSKKAFAEYMENIEAYAATNLHIEFIG